MERREIILSQFETVGRQLAAVLEGFPGPGLHSKLSEPMMTPMEMVEHLCDCYSAYTSPDPGKYGWGSYKLSASDLQGALSELAGMRSKAKDLILTAEDPDTVMHAFDYVIAHDAYHVGQLAACRMACDPSWDPFSLYA